MASDNPVTTVEVRAPRLRRRPRGLLLDITEPIDESAVRPSDEGSRSFNVGDRIAGGINFVGEGCSTLDTYENQWCEEVTIPADASSCEGHEFSSFVIVDRENAPAYFHEPWIEERIRRRFGVQTSAQVARELLTGAMTGNPSLVGNATEVVGALTPVDEALFVVNELAAALDGAEVTIHTSPGLFELLIANYDIDQDELGTEDDPTSRPFRTATGHVIVGDAGHDGSQAPDGETTDGGGSWLYATLPVMTWLSDPEPVGQFSARFDHERDALDSIFIRHAIAGFDPCWVAAVQVEVPEYAVGS